MKLGVNSDCHAYFQRCADPEIAKRAKEIGETLAQLRVPTAT
jgi:hypothetical protein